MDQLQNLEDNLQGLINENKNEEEPTQIRSYRISKQKFNIKIGLNECLEQVVPLNNYKVFLYFEEDGFGLIRVIDVKQKGKQLNDKGTRLEGNNEYQNLMYHAFAYDENSVCYINTEKQRLEWFNTETLEYECKFNAQVPTQEAISQKDREDKEKLSNLYKDGTKLQYLKDSQTIVLMESKMSYISNNNEVVLTAFHQDSENFKYQKVFTQQAQKMLSLNKLNHSDSIACWGQQFSDNPIDFHFWKVDEDIKKVTLTENIDGLVQEYQPWEEGKIAIFYNVNLGGYPALKTVSLEDIKQNDTVLEQTQELNVFDKGGNNEWVMTDFFMCDYQQQKVLWERQTDDSTYVDVYNPHFKQCTFSQQIEEDDVEDEDYTPDDIEKSISPNAKYFIGYNSNIPDPEDDADFKEVPIVLNSVVSVGASLLHVLKQTNLYDQLGEDFSQEIIDLLLRQQ